MMRSRRHPDNTLQVKVILSWYWKVRMVSMKTCARLSMTNTKEPTPRVVHLKFFRFAAVVFRSFRLLDAFEEYRIILTSSQDLERG